MAIILSLTLIIGASMPLTGCGGSRRIYIYVPSGPPLIAAAHMFYENEDVVYSGGTRRVRYVQTTGAVISSQLARRNPPDFALAPINLAATNYNITGDFVFGGVALWGIFHIVENVGSGGIVPIQDLSELRGEVIAAYQRNMSPGVVLETILEKAGLTVNPIMYPLELDSRRRDDAVNIVYLSNNAEASAAVLGLPTAIVSTRFALVAEPEVSAITQRDYIKSPFNMQAEWYREFGFSFPQVAIMVRATLAQREPELVSAVIDMISSSIAKATADPVDTARVVETLNPAYMAEAPAIISFLDSVRGQEVFSFASVSESRTAVESFLTVLYERRAPVGGRVPDDGFFFGV